MALYTATLDQLRATVQLALDGQSADAQFGSDTNLINEAISEFSGMHPWAWRRAALSLNTIASQNYIDLPTDLAHVDNIAAVGTSLAPTQPVTLEELVAMRQASLGVSGNRWYWSVSWQSQASVTVLPRPRLELYPTPTASVTPAFVGHYQKIIANLTDPTDVPNVPSNLQPLLRQWVRLFARREYGLSLGEQQKAFDANLARALNEEGAVQRNLGPLRGGTDDVPVKPIPPVINMR